jgi:putative transport protein
MPRSINVTSWLAGVLGESSILTLFVVIGLGFLLGEVSFFGLRFVAGRQFLGVRFDALLGLASGVQTQPACLDGLAHSDVPSVAYATVYPTAMIVKILVAQLLLA